jgi:hypothetical protein
MYTFAGFGMSIGQAGRERMTGLQRFGAFLFLLAVIAGTGMADPGDIFYVDQGNTSGIEDGLSWATAFTKIEPAIETARTRFGGEVWVARGVYGEDRSNVGTLRLRPTVNLYGGFSGGEVSRNQRDPLNNVTVIDGATANAGQAAPTVILGASNCTLDGFTIRGGNGQDGVGMLNIGVSPRIINCVFTSNSASRFGGAMLNVDGAAPRIVDCVFTNNSAGQNGGAVANVQAAPYFENCRFSVNASTGPGGAIFNLEGSNTIINNCIFERNSAESGAAIFNEASSPAIESSVFLQNTAQKYGGALFNSGESDAFIVNCVVARNTAELGGAAVANLASTFTSVNCTIADNVSPVPGSVLLNNMSTTNVLNAVIWYNSEDPFLNVSSFTEIRWSNVGGGDRGPNNIAVEPRFKDRANSDYTLAPDSPNINAATPNGAPAADLLGVERPQGDGVDMGAYESTVIAPPASGFDCSGLARDLLGGKSDSRHQSADAGLLAAVVLALAGARPMLRRRRSQTLTVTRSSSVARQG